MTKPILFFVFLSFSLQAQHILKSDVLHQNEVHTQHYMFVKADAKNVERDWKTYLSKLGKVAENKGEISVSGVKNSGLGSFVDRAVSSVRHEKDFSVISLLLFDDSGRSLDDKQINREGLEKLFYDFYDVAYFNEEVRMAEEDLNYANTLLKQAEKEKGKAERNVEANLKAQEKLGKKLSQSPEEISKILKEKDALYQELVQAEETEKEAEALQQKINKKDKAIVKAKQQKEKNSGKLADREKEFPKLSEELFAAKKHFEKLQQVEESKKLVIQDLKAKK
jgi:hypothetical protein